MATVFYEDDDATFVQERNLLMAIYRGCPTVTHIRALRAELERQQHRWPEGVASVISTHADGWVPRFDDAFREEVRKLVAVSETCCLGTAFVFTGHGMVIAGLRAFVNGVFLVSRSKEPNRVFRDFPPAADWLMARPGMEVRWSGAELLDCGLAHGVGGGVIRRAG